MIQNGRWRSIGVIALIALAAVGFFLSPVVVTDAKAQVCTNANCNGNNTDDGKTCTVAGNPQCGTCVNGVCMAPAGSGLPAVLDGANGCSTLGAQAAGAPALGNSDYTSKIVYCVQYTIQQATTTLLTSLSGFMTGTVAAMFTLAIVVFGMHTLTGTGEMKTRAPAFFLRLGIVGMFSYNLAGLSMYVFASEQQLLTLVSGGVSPWAQIDGFLGMLVGFASCNLQTIDLTKGLLGLIAAAMFSTTVGFAVFIAGLMMLVEVVLFVSDVVYTYLTAVLVIGFQLAISPFIIPLAVFFYTEKYFTKWLNMLIAAMITPVILFAFLNLFLNLLNVFISNILAILGVTCTNANDLCTCTIDFHTFWRLNVPIFTWLAPADPSFNNELWKVDPKGIDMPPIPGVINPFLRLGVSINPGSWPNINFGNAANDWSIKTQLVFSFVSLWVFASVMKSITLRIPQVAESIAGSVSGVSVQPSPLTKLAKGTDGYDKFDLGKYEDFKPGAK